MTETNNQDNFEKELKNKIKTNKMVVVEYGQTFENAVLTKYSNNPDNSDDPDIIQVINHNKLDNMLNNKFLDIKYHKENTKRREEAEIWYAQAVEKHKKKLEEEEKLKLKYGDKYIEPQYRNNSKPNNNQRRKNMKNITLGMAIREHGQPYNCC